MRRVVMGLITYSWVLKPQQIYDLLRSGLSLHQTVHHTSLVVWSRHRPLTEPAQFGELHASPPGHQVGGQLRVVGQQVSL